MAKPRWRSLSAEEADIAAEIDIIAPGAAVNGAIVRYHYPEHAGCPLHARLRESQPKSTPVTRHPYDMEQPPAACGDA